MRDAQDTQPRVVEGGLISDLELVYLRLLELSIVYSYFQNGPT